MDNIIDARDNPTGLDTIQDSITGAYVQGITQPAVADSVPQFKRWDSVRGGVPNTVRAFCSIKSYMTLDGGPRDDESPVSIDFPRNKDFLMLVAGRSRVASAAAGDPVSPDPLYPGCPTMDIYTRDPVKQLGNLLFACRPYNAGYGGVDEDATRTRGYCHLIQRDSGKDYIIMVVRRGSTIEHFVGWDDRDGDMHYVLADTAAEVTPGMFARLETQNNIQFSHISSATPRPAVDVLGTPRCGATTLWETFNQAQDYYGAMIIDFNYGAPSQGKCVRSMKWHLEHWRDGDKSIYPLCAADCCH